MRRTYIAPISFGLGDLIVSLPAIQALITEHKPRETWLVARASGQAALADRIAGLGGCVDEDAFEPAGAGDSFFDLRDHALQPYRHQKPDREHSGEQCRQDADETTQIRQVQPIALQRIDCGGYKRDNDRHADEQCRQAQQIRQRAAARPRLAPN